jgi:hypothetical protein
VTARAGAAVADIARPDLDATVPAPRPRVPKPRQLPDRELRLLALYQRAERAARDTGSGTASLTAAFAQVHEVLKRDYPHEWLARWNLLETLIRRAPTEPLAAVLRDELDHLEVALGQREPIASGLRYLDSQG